MPLVFLLAAQVFTAQTTNSALQDSLIMQPLKITEVQPVLIQKTNQSDQQADNINYHIQTVTAAELNQAVPKNVTEALMGKVSGLTITRGSGAGAFGGANSQPWNLRLRGYRSLFGRNDPLIVIDGAISSQTTAESLPPSVIENVDVIKGQSGVGRWGTGAANGVIVITTKGGD